MKISEATAFIRTPRIDATRPQCWYDLGCGRGTFTLALARSLAPGSTIHAVDRDQEALAAIPEEEHGVIIRKVVADLRSAGLPLVAQDGILMANSLHFLPDQSLFLKKLRSLANAFLVVEYERSTPAPWGPYPVGFERLCQLFREAGMPRVAKLATRRSRFGGTMYSAFAASGNGIAPGTLSEAWK